MGKSKKDTGVDVDVTDPTDDAPAADVAAAPVAEDAAPSTLRVRVLRAVAPYHHRNATLTVPDDEFHRGLLKQGNLKAVD